MSVRTSARAVSCLVAVLAAAASGSAAGDAVGAGAAVASQESVAAAGNVTIVVSFGTTSRGRYSARGAFSGSGIARLQRTLSGKRMRMTLSLRAKGGTLTILNTQTCGTSRSTWRLLFATRTYRGFTGAGTGRGSLVCGDRSAYRAVLNGRLRPPPLGPIAKAGVYSSTDFDKNLRATLEVAADGRTVTDVSFRGLIARCQPPRLRFLEPRFGGPFAIGAGASFSIASGGFLVSAKFTRGQASGTISFDAEGCKLEPLSWKAAPDAAPPPSGLTGRYCGYTLRGPGICLDATSDGWVANARMGANITCITPSETTFSFSYTYPGLIAIRPDGTFSVDLPNVPLDGGGSMRWRLDGRFDASGQVSGIGGFTSISLVRDGTRYQCRNARSAFTAKRGA